jgi:hypothetical protein
MVSFIKSQGDQWNINHPKESPSFKYQDDVQKNLSLRRTEEKCRNVSRAVSWGFGLIVAASLLPIGAAALSFGATAILAASVPALVIAAAFTVGILAYAIFSSKKKQMSEITALKELDKLPEFKDSRPSLRDILQYEIQLKIPGNWINHKGIGSNVALALLSKGYLGAMDLIGPKLEGDKKFLYDAAILCPQVMNYKKNLYINYRYTPNSMRKLIIQNPKILTSCPNIPSVQLIIKGLNDKSFDFEKASNEDLKVNLNSLHLVANIQSKASDPVSDDQVWNYLESRNEGVGKFRK